MTFSDDLDLNDLPVFLALVEAGGFTAAAERLGCAKTRVSLVIKRLETRLGVTLFHRTTRSVRLTDAGEHLYRECAPLLESLGRAVAASSSPEAGLSGELRITAPESYAEQILTPAVLAFRERHPELRIELRSGDRVSDLLSEGIDVAIRLGWLRDSSQRATRLGTFQQWAVAAPDYLRHHGMPRVPEDLADHRWVAFSPLRSPLTWTFRRGAESRRVQVQAGLSTNTTSTVRSLLLQGAGISVIADLSARAAVDSGDLVRLLPEWTLPEGGVYAVYPPGRYVPARVRRFVDFLRQEGGAEVGFSD